MMKQDFERSSLWIMTQPRIFLYSSFKLNHESNANKSLNTDSLKTHA